MNINNDSSIRTCTSCGVCAVSCAKKAIRIQLDLDGFYRPVVDEGLCNDCGLCVSVCYKFDDDVKMTSSHEIQEKPLYSAWSNNNELVKCTTSGGIGDLLAHQLLKEGYKVVGVVYNEEKTRAEHRVAKSEKDLNSFRGSKYIQSYTYDAFKEVVANCRNEKYAVFGTPCQIYALNRFAAKRRMRDNFVFVDLFCHGCPSLYAWTKYQASIKKSMGVDRFDSVVFRSKQRGWGTFYVVIEADGKPMYISKRANDMFYELFFSNQVLNEACSNCILRSTLEYTDIRMGDFWGHKFIDNQRGVSAISLSTKKGEEIFNKLTEIVKNRCSYEDFLPYQSWQRSYDVDIKTRSEILTSLSDAQSDIDTAISVLRKNQGIRASAMRHIKSLLAHFPIGLTNRIKKLLYRIR